MRYDTSWLGLEADALTSLDLLLDRARSPRAGGSIRWRGDFDWTGLRTTGAAVARFGATPWLMDIETYSAALDRGESEPLKERDHRAESPWEPTLAREMALRGRAVMEERLVERLLADLA